MSLTRKFLSAMGIEADKVDEIISAHAETVDALKDKNKTLQAEADKYKADAEKLPDVQKELDELKKAQGDEEPYKAKYEKEKADFEAYKNDQAAKETEAKKTAAYKALLKNAGISEKHIDAVLRASDLSSVELDDKGSIKDAEKATEAIKTEWSDFIVTTGKQGANTSTPPTGDDTTGHHGTGRAAQIAAKFQADHYGTPAGATPGANGGASGTGNNN